MSTTFELALQLIETDRAADAEETMREAVRAALQRDGAESVAHADRLYELASVLLRAGDPTRAVQPLAEAAGIRVARGGPAAEKQRLMYEMNLGEVLTRLGRLEDAEGVMRRNVSAREAFSGEDHAGFAYGVEQLADVLRARGAIDEARALVDLAVDVFWNAGNPRAASALATRAPLAKLGGLPAFDGAVHLPDELFGAMVHASVAREAVDEPAVHLLVVRELWGVTRERCGAAATLTLEVVASVVRTARRAGALDAAREGAESLVAAFDAAADARGAVNAVLGLALIEDGAGHFDAAATLYGNAVMRAERLGDAAVHSNALRNHGLFVAERGDAARARALLRAASRVAIDGDCSATITSPHRIASLEMFPNADRCLMNFATRQGGGKHGEEDQRGRAARVGRGDRRAVSREHA